GSGGAVGHPMTTPATIRRLVGVSTRLNRPGAQSDSDRVALEYNGAREREMDYQRSVKACSDRYAKASRRHAASRDIPLVTPWQRTRFASRSAIDTGR